MAETEHPVVVAVLAARRMRLRAAVAVEEWEQAMRKRHEIEAALITAQKVFEQAAKRADEANQEATGAYAEMLLVIDQEVQKDEDFSEEVVVVRCHCGRKIEMIDSDGFQNEKWSHILAPSWDLEHVPTPREGQG